MWIFFQIHTYFSKCLPVLLINFSPFPLQICLWGRALFSKQPWALHATFQFSSWEKAVTLQQVSLNLGGKLGPPQQAHCLWSSPCWWQDTQCIVFVPDLTRLLPWVASRQNPASFIPTLCCWEVSVSTSTPHLHLLLGSPYRAQLTVFLTREKNVLYKKVN